MMLNVVQPQAGLLQLCCCCQPLQQQLLLLLLPLQDRILAIWCAGGTTWIEGRQLREDSHGGGGEGLHKIRPQKGGGLGLWQ